MQIGKPSWMPYANQGEVAVRLGDFVNETLGPQVGLVWSDPSGSAVIRLPRFDADGYGFTLVARCTGPVMPAPTQKSSGVWQSIEDALAERAKSSPGGAGATRFYMRPGTAPADPNAVTLDQVIEAHPKLFDGIGSVLDIAGLIAGWGSAFTVFTGGMAIMPALGALAFGACLVMLAADGGAFLMELDGKKALAEEYHHSEFFQWTQAIAPLLMGVDAVVHAPKEIANIVNEVGKLKTEIPTLQAEGAKVSGELGKVQTEHASTLAEHPRGTQPLSADEARLRQNKLQKERRHIRKLTDEIAAMQDKVAQASQNLLSKSLLLKVNNVALRGMGYSGAMYALDPADPVKDGFSWVETRFTPRSAGPTRLVHHIVFHVAVARQSASGQ